MVSTESIAAQLRKIGFNEQAWGRAEVRELPNIILPDEEIFECVNGVYEGGFALLVATDVRVLLIDKKPFNYLTVEDLRFDMINEIDYSHRALGAYVDISTGNRELKFRSYNRPRLRKLINHVQHRMAAIKNDQAVHQQGQNQHLEQINSHLRTYLVEQYKHQEELQRRLEEAQRGQAIDPESRPPKPSPELADYLLAHGLLNRYEAETGQKLEVDDSLRDEELLREQLYAEGRQEIFSNSSGPVSPSQTSGDPDGAKGGVMGLVRFDTNPLKLAYSKLPLAMRIRRRPSLDRAGQPEAEIV